MTITSALREELAEEGMSMERFQELVIRLMAYGVVVRDEDRTEQAIYDDARRVETLLADCFGTPLISALPMKMPILQSGLLSWGSSRMKR